jgi:hypothetical protein
MKLLPRNSAVIALCGGTLLIAGSTFAGPNDPVSPTSASRDACFRVQQIDGWAPRGTDGVNIRSHNAVYQADFTVPCLELPESTRISLRSTSGGSYICSGPDAELIAYSRLANANRCTIQTLRRLTPSQVAALPKGERP